jgi:hypothetical protein
MKENNLLASVALFSELYNNENYTSVADILGEFIKGVVCTENKWTVNTTELTNLLEKVYEFRIPESVVRTTARNRLTKISTFQNGHYVFDPIIKNDFEKINENYNAILKHQNAITTELIKFVEQKENRVLQENEKQILFDSLSKYLLDNSVSEKYSNYISAFVIKNQGNAEFTNGLNLIKEGVILYQGIKFTADINELGKWNTELTIFLSTEHLFNSLGFNGILYQQIFDDFYNLVSEINFSNKNKYGEKLIQLKYLEETRDEIAAFFQTAEYIHKGTLALDTSKPAMKAILDGCRYPSDIIAKKVKFENDLRAKGITLKEFNQSIYNYTEYVVEDENVIEELKKSSESKGRTFDENLCRQFFRIFTKINYFRGGESKTKFEKIGHIYITGNRFALYLAHQNKVKFQEEDIPFAKDIDYITNKFWFKLKKGFSDKNNLPKSFDVVSKAQTILSSQLNQSVFQEYHKLQKQLKEGSLTKEEAMERSYELREKPNKPEEITIENIDSSLDFLTNDSYFEDLFREKEKKEILLKETQQQNEALQNEIKRRDEIERQKELAQKAEQKNELKLFYQNENWKDYKKQQRGNSFYSIMVMLLTIFPIFIGFMLKANKKLSDWMDSQGASQFWIWAILSIIFLAELFGRSYIFNKEKVKNGWLWINLRGQYFAERKEQKYNEFEADFERQNPD